MKPPLIPTMQDAGDPDQVPLERVVLRKSRLRGLHDWLGLIVRRRMWVIIPFLALSALTVVFSTMLPRVYVSQTMILIQPREVPTDFVKDLIAGSTDQRLGAIEQTILSRSNLLKILNEFEGRMPGYRGLNDDLKVIKLKKQIQIDFPSERRRGQWTPVTNCIISYRDQDPELAQKITARLASLFIEQDSRARESQVFGTTEFFEAELNKVTQQLKQSEDRLKVVKEKYRFELPGQLETNLRTLDRLQLQRTANVEALDRHTTMQMILERQLSETQPVLTPEAAARSQVVLPSAPTPNPLIAVYRQKETEYNQLRSRVTPKHPDIQRAKSELEQLKAQIPPEDWPVLEQTPLTPLSPQAAPEPVAADPAAKNPPVAAPGPAGKTVPNPVYQSLTAQLGQLKTEIQIREREKQLIEAEMERYIQRVQNTPGVEQEMAAVMRANAELMRQSEDLRAKLDQAKLAGSLESRQKGSQFVIIDPANYPLEPAAPKLAMILMGGFVLSLGAGLAAAVVVDGFVPKVWTHMELERYLGAPVMVEIPSMVTLADAARARRRKLAQVGVLLLFAGVYAGGLYFLYLKQNAVVRILDPLIERIMRSGTPPISS